MLPSLAKPISYTSASSNPVVPSPLPSFYNLPTPPSYQHLCSSCCPNVFHLPSLAVPLQPALDKLCFLKMGKERHRKAPVHLFHLYNPPIRSRAQPGSMTLSPGSPLLHNARSQHMPLDHASPLLSTLFSAAALFPTVRANEVRALAAFLTLTLPVVNHPSLLLQLPIYLCLALLSILKSFPFPFFFFSHWF